MCHMATTKDDCSDQAKDRGGFIYPWKRTMDKTFSRLGKVWIYLIYYCGMSSPKVNLFQVKTVTNIPAKIWDKDFPVSENHLSLSVDVPLEENDLSVPEKPHHTYGGGLNLSLLWSKKVTTSDTWWKPTIKN